MADGKPNGKPVQNSLLSGASGNYLFDDLSSATVLVPVVDQILVSAVNSLPSINDTSNFSADATTEVDLNSDDPVGNQETFSHFMPSDSPQNNSGIFHTAPPMPSSVQMFTQDPGQFNIPTQAISSPLISSESFTARNTSSAETGLVANVEQSNAISTTPEHILDDSTNLPGTSAFGIATTNTHPVWTQPSYSDFTDPVNATSSMLRTNTATTANNGNSELTNVVGSSAYANNNHQRVPEPFGSLQTPPLTKPPPPDSANNNFRLGSQRPIYAPYPGLIHTPTPRDVVPSLVPQPLSYTNPYNTANDVGTNLYNFGAPVPVHHSPYGHDLKQTYHPVTFHWFFKKESDGRYTWKPFSLRDSIALEEAYISQMDAPVATDGGRHDVYVRDRTRKSVYWDEDPSEVRRCSWFYKGPMDSRFVPYDEEFSARLEDEYAHVMATGVWHKRLEFPDGEAIVFHNANVIVHFCKAAAPDEWGSVPESQLRPRVVKRGVGEEFEIQDGESSRIDTLVFLVHGIGAICDFKFRCIDEAVDGFRNLSFALMQSHFREATEAGKVGRIEFLPVSWHKALHGDRGVDEQLRKLTLPSIPKLRHFTNDTLLDILFYTSPKYCQTVMNTVGNEMNKMYSLFLSRNKDFNGQVALGGHSLGSLILFDLLYHQPTAEVKTTTILQEPSAESSVVSLSQSQINILASNTDVDQAWASANSSETAIPHPGSTPRMVSFSLGAAGTGQPYIVYPRLNFHPTAFFAIGSPTAMFVTVRGLEKLGQDFHLPTCPAYFNIFHPFDPVAYRLEPLIVENFDPEPVMIPHHKGRKRFHLELKDTMIRFGVDVKTKFVDSLISTFNTVVSTVYSKKTEVNENEAVSPQDVQPEPPEPHIYRDNCPSRLNKGRRIDYVLQEAPVESINEYLFALSSHVCYWESEDTMLMIMREIYNNLGVQEDSAFAGYAPFNETQHTAYENYYDPQDIGPAAKILLKDQGDAKCCDGKSTSQHHLEVHSTTNIPSTSHYQGLSGPPPYIVQTSNNVTSPAPIEILTPCIPNNMNQAASSVNTGNNEFACNAAGPTVIGSRPVANPGDFPIGMDPTAPPSHTSIGPPPLAGFQRRN